MKPILFNTEMVRAILDGRKSATRRVVKTRYCDSVLEMYQGTLCEASPYKPPVDNGDGTTTHFVRAYVPCRQPYQPGDILYVRETFFEHCGKYFYTADKTRINRLLEISPEKLFKWRPSIHMPKEAARLFLRVTGVRVERLQDMQPYDIAFEGFRRQRDFIALWGSTTPPRYGWAANPWVWVIEFEQISREEAKSGI